MNKLIIAAMVLMGVSLVVPGPAVAQETYFNQLGLYLTPDGPDGSGRSGTNDIGVPVNVYLVLTRPVDVQNGNAPYPDLNAFECTLSFLPVPSNNLFLLSAALPPNSVDVGSRKNINDGFLDYIVGVDMLNPVLVTNESAVLISFLIMNTAVSTFEVYLGPTPIPAIPGEMAFQSVSGELRVMHPASGFFNEPVFEFNGEAVAVDQATFGSVKSLFR